MKNNKRILCLLLFVVLFLVGCSPLRTPVKKGSSKLFETFYLGEKGTQYFVKPLLFENKEGDKMSVDFTFLYNEKIQTKDSVTLNFSIFLPNVDMVNNLTLQIGNEKKQSAQITKLFKDAKQSRFSTRVQLSDVKRFFEVERKSIILKREYFPKKSTAKKLQKVSKSVFVN